MPKLGTWSGSTQIAGSLVFSALVGKRSTSSSGQIACGAGSGQPTGTRLGAPPSPAAAVDVAPPGVVVTAPEPPDGISTAPAPLLPPAGAAVPPALASNCARPPQATSSERSTNPRHPHAHRPDMPQLSMREPTRLEPRLPALSQSGNGRFGSRWDAEGWAGLRATGRPSIKQKH